MPPEEVRQKISDALEAARKFGDERGLPEDFRLAIETTGESWLNVFDAYAVHAAETAERSQTS